MSNMHNDSCLYVLDSFDTHYLNILIDNDETLYDAIMISFQLKVLEQLLLFCGEGEKTNRKLHLPAIPYKQSPLTFLL
jgi:hypothetical protein